MGNTGSADISLLEFCSSGRLIFSNLRIAETPFFFISQPKDCLLRLKWHFLGQGHRYVG